MTKLSNLKRDLRKYQDKKKAVIFARFFKTGPGEYAEGDQFLGLKVPQVRAVVEKYSDLALTDLKKLLVSKIHEERAAAIVILVKQFKKGDLKVKKRIYQFYLANLAGVNNWDLVDISADRVVGAYLDSSGESRGILYKLAKSKILWERRVAIMATFHFIKKNEFEETLRIAKILLKDKEDLIHKAVGWMLRETGKRDLAVEEKFLKRHYQQMPRTMLRYAIEKFEENKRQAYLKGLI